MCENTLCELFFNHEERLKGVEVQLCSLRSLLNQLQYKLSQLQNQIDSLLQSSLRESLFVLLNSTVTIQTNAGSITGILFYIGDSFIEVLEPSGDLVFMLIASIVGF